MVGLYHKRRASRSSSSKLLRFFIRLSFILGVFVVVGFTLTALFFNGSQVKGPLSIYLSSKFNMEVSIGDAEFSPIYPDVIKLYNVQFGNSKIGELYLEYDIRSALGDDELIIKDLYLDKINIEPDDLLSLSESKLGFNSIRAQTVRFYGTPLRTVFLKSPSSTVRLEQVTYSSQEGLTFRSGALSTGQAHIFGDEVKNFNIEFTHNDKGIAIKNFTAGILGGTVTGYGNYNIISNEPQSEADILHNHMGIHPVSAEIVLDELNLTKVILNQGLRAPKNVKLSAKKTNLTDVIFTNNIDPAFNKKSNNQGSKLFAKDANPNSENQAPKSTKEGESESSYLSYIMQGINGTIDDLYIDNQNIEGMFDGHIDEISFPNLQTTFEHNNTIASFANDKLEFDIAGSLYEGSFNSIGGLDFNKKRLSITELRMHKNKLALNPPRLDFIKQQFSDHCLFIKYAKFNQLEFLSYVNSLPLSIQTISGTANNIFVHPTLLKDLEHELSKDKEKNLANHDHQNSKALDKTNEADSFYKLLSYLTLDDNAIAASKEESLNINKHKFIINPDIYSDNQETRNVIKQKSPSSLNLNLINMLYSNLLMSETNVNIKLDENGLAIDIPKMRFKESSLNAQAYLALHEKIPSKLTIKANDFETADLNSNLIDHMLTGKVNFDLNIESTCKNKINNLVDLLDHSNGQITLSSPAMLIADFGLDLINGGNLESYKLSSTELLSAIQGSVAGINNLNAQAKVNNGLFNINTTASLVTSNLSLNSQVDFNNASVSGRAFLISQAKDSSTQVTLSGNTKEPVFNIKALRRGEKRPGLYLPQYKSSALAKEQTDAAPVLKGKVLMALDPATKPQNTTQSQLKEESLPPQTSTTNQALEGKQAPQEQGTSTPQEQGAASNSMQNDDKAAPDSKDAPAQKQEQGTASNSMQNDDDKGDALNSQEQGTASNSMQDDDKGVQAAPNSQEQGAASNSMQDDDEGAALNSQEQGAASNSMRDDDKGGASPNSQEQGAASNSMQNDDKGVQDTPNSQEQGAASNSMQDDDKGVQAAPNSQEQGAASNSMQDDDNKGAVLNSQEQGTASNSMQDDDDNGGAPKSKDAPAFSKEELNSDAKHAQDMIDEEHQALNRQKQLEDQANETEMELFKDALIDSIISRPYNSNDEEELIF